MESQQLTPNLGLKVFAILRQNLRSWSGTFDRRRGRLRRLSGATVRGAVVLVVDPSLVLKGRFWRRDGVRSGSRFLKAISVSARR